MSARCSASIRTISSRASFQSPGEPLGSALTDEEFEQNIEALRVLIRPDLFVMGDDGIAKRKS